MFLHSSVLEYSNVTASRVATSRTKVSLAARSGNSTRPSVFSFQKFHKARRVQTSGVRSLYGPGADATELVRCVDRMPGVSISSEIEGCFDAT